MYTHVKRQHQQTLFTAKAKMATILDELECYLYNLDTQFEDTNDQTIDYVIKSIK